MSSDREFDCYRGDDATRVELKKAAYEVMAAILEAAPIGDPTQSSPSYPLDGFWLGNSSFFQSAPTRS